MGLTWDSAVVVVCATDTRLVWTDWLAVVAWTGIGAGALCDAVGVEIAVLCWGLREAFLCYAPDGSSVSFRCCVWLDADVEGGGYLVVERPFVSGGKGDRRGELHGQTFCVLVGREVCWVCRSCMNVTAAGTGWCIDFFSLFFCNGMD